MQAFPGVAETQSVPIFRLVEMCRGNAVDLMRTEKLLREETSTVLSVVAERGRSALDPSERVEYRIGHSVELRAALAEAADIWAHTVMPRVSITQAAAESLELRNITGPELVDLLGLPSSGRPFGWLHHLKPGRPTRLAPRVAADDTPYELVAGITTRGRRLVVGVDEDPARESWKVRWAAEPKSKAFAKLECEVVDPPAPAGPLEQSSGKETIVSLLHDGGLRQCMARLDMLLEDKHTSLRTSRVLVQQLATSGFASAGLRAGVALMKRFEIDDIELLAHGLGHTRARLQSLDVLFDNDRSNRRTVEWVHRALRDGRDPSNARTAATNVQRMSGTRF